MTTTAEAVLYLKRRQQREDFLAEIALELESVYCEEGPKKFRDALIAGFGIRKADAICNYMRALRSVRKKLGEP